jgi:hypothetical protein
VADLGRYPYVVFTEGQDFGEPDGTVKNPENLTFGKILERRPAATDAKRAAWTQRATFASYCSERKFVKSLNPPSPRRHPKPPRKRMIKRALISKPHIQCNIRKRLTRIVEQ